MQGMEQPGLTQPVDGLCLVGHKLLEHSRRCVVDSIILTIYERARGATTSGGKSWPLCEALYPIRARRRGVHLRLCLDRNKLMRGYLASDGILGNEYVPSAIQFDITAVRFMQIR